MSISGRPRRAVLIVSSVVGIALLGDSMLYVALPVRAHEVGIPIGLVGLLLSANRIIRLVSNTFAAHMYRRWGTKKPFVAAIGLAAVSTAIYGLFSGFWMFLLARVVWGICFSLLRLGGHLAVLAAAGPHERGRFLGTFHAIARGGSVAGAMGGGLLSDLIGLQTTAILFAALTLLGLPLSILGLAAKRPEAGDDVPSREAAKENDRGHSRPGPGIPSREAEEEGSETASPPTTASPRDARRLLVAVNFAGFATGFTGRGVIMATLALLLETSFGPQVSILGAAVGISTLTGALFAFRWISDMGLAAFLGGLADRFGPPRMAVVTLIMQAAAVVSVVHAGALVPTMLAVAILLVITTAGLLSVETSAANQAAGGNAAQVMSRFVTWTDLGSALGPLAGYAIAAQFGLVWAYWLGALLLLGSALVFPRQPGMPGHAGERASATQRQI